MPADRGTSKPAQTTIDYATPRPRREKRLIDPSSLFIALIWLLLLVAAIFVCAWLPGSGLMVFTGFCVAPTFAILAVIFLYIAVFGRQEFGDD